MVTCAKKTLVYSRIVGYHNPINAWNKGQRSQFKERVPYVVRGIRSKSIYGGDGSGVDHVGL